MDCRLFVAVFAAFTDTLYLLACASVCVCVRALVYYTNKYVHTAVCICYGSNKNNNNNINFACNLGNLIRTS